MSEPSPPNAPQPNLLQRLTEVAKRAFDPNLDEHSRASNLAAYKELIAKYAHPSLIICSGLTLLQYSDMDAPPCAEFAYQARATPVMAVETIRGGIDTGASSIGWSKSYVGVCLQRAPEQ